MIVKKYPKSLSGLIEKKIGIWWMEKRGYIVYAMEDCKEFSGGKALGLGLLFLPLALLGGKKYWKVTFLLCEVAGNPNLIHNYKK